MHHLKEGYQSRARPAYFLDDPTDTSGIVYQPDVYPLAMCLAELTRADTIVDLGCGWGQKLAAIHAQHPEWQYHGYDWGLNHEHCARTYAWGKWHHRDLEKIQKLPPGAVVVCADVIEHLIDPTALVTTLARSRAKVVVLSTPERDRTYGPEHIGPPPNEAHVREWNTAELRALLGEADINVRFTGLTRGHDRQTLDAAATVVVVATVKG